MHVNLENAEKAIEAAAGDIAKQDQIVRDYQVLRDKIHNGDKKGKAGGNANEADQEAAEIAQEEARKLQSGLPFPLPFSL